MKEEFNELQVVKNDETQQFELTVDGYIAFIEFREKPSHISLIHTESPPELEGRGVATALIEKTLAYLEANNYKLLPLCPLVFAYIKKNPTWIRIVEPSFQQRFSS